MHPWRERLGRWLTPVARATSFSPNAITIVALILNLIASALFLGGWQRPPLFVIALAPIILAGFADALDGIVARTQHKETRFGDFLDHLCDRISDTLLAACWMIGSGVHEILVVAVTIVVMLNGYAGTQIEATFGSRNYDSLGRGEFVLALIVFPIVSFTLFSNGWRSLEYGGRSVPDWMSLLLLVFALAGIVQRIGVARRTEKS